MNKKVGSLKVKCFDFNDPKKVGQILRCLKKLIHNSSLHSLRVKPPYYFEVPEGLQEKKGWYVILCKRVPIYVGWAKNLNSRLNTDSGSRDNFANKKRKSDSKRNFIKKLSDLNRLGELKICVITLENLCADLNIDSKSITRLDWANIEKFIDIFRSSFVYPG